MMQQFGLDLVLVEAWLADLHRAAVGGGGNLGRPAHRLDFLAALVHPHLVHVMRDGMQLVGRVHAGARLARHAVQPAEQALVEVLVAPHRVIDALLVLDQPRQDVVEIGDRKGVVRAVQLAGALEAGAAAMPGLRFRVLFAAEQDVFALRAIGDQHHHRLGFGKSGEVVDIAVRTVGIIDVAIADPLGGGRLDGDAAAVDDVHQFLAAAGEFTLVHGRLGSSAEAGLSAGGAARR